MRQIIATLLLLFAVDVATAHEKGLQHVEIAVSSDQFTATTPIEPLNLLNRLELSDGSPITIEGSAPQIQAALQARQAAIARAITISFETPRGRVNTAPAIKIANDVLELSGSTPPGATHVVWTNRLATGDSVLFVRDGALESNTPLHANESSAPVALTKRVTFGETFIAYLRLGVLHIVPRGLDHILFVLGLFFLSSRLRTLLAQISLFTLAHTVTLGLSIFGVVSLDPRIVEPLIALSIVYVAIENIIGKGSSRVRLVIVTLFGLLHGLGFASVLRDVGLPTGSRVSALIAFNLGVETGQLLVVASAAAVVAIYHHWNPDAHRRLAVPVSIGIAAIGLWWTIQRVLG